MANVLKLQYFILLILFFAYRGKPTFSASPKLGSHLVLCTDNVYSAHLYFICDHIASELCVCFCVALSDGVHRVQILCLIHLCVPST